MATIYANDIPEFNFNFTEKSVHLRFQEKSAEGLRGKKKFSLQQNTPNK